MLLTRKDKIVAGLITFFIISAWVALAWLSKIGGFSILADVIRKGL